MPQEEDFEQSPDSIILLNASRASDDVPRTGFI